MAPGVPFATAPSNPRESPSSGTVCSSAGVARGENEGPLSAESAAAS
jgi:hypothetical protein